MIAPHRNLHSLFAASALLASLQLLAGCAASDRPPDEALRSAFPDHAAAVLSLGPGFVRSGGGLERAAAGRGGVAARLPSEGSDAIVFALDGGATLRVREVGAEGEAMLADRAVAYRRAGGSSFWSATPAGVEEWLLLEAAAVQRGAPVAAWEVEGGALAERDGAIEIADASGAVRLRVTAPAAYAAGGREVGLRLAARGGQIELFVDAEGEQVLVDPAWQSPLPPTMATRRSHHAAALLGTRVLVTGGVNPYGVLLDSTELYDPAENAWSTAPTPGPMERARTDHAAIALDGDRVLMIGGDRDGADSTYEVYDARTMSWEVEGTIPLDHPLNAARPAPLHRHTATRLGRESGDVLIVGGTADLDSVAIYDNVFRYDPSTGAIEEVASLLEPRALHTATLLQTGKVLVVGGYRGGAGLRTTELYDPATDTWTAGPSTMEGAERYMHTATLLPDGRVLVLGYSSLTEIYDPSTNSFSLGAPMPTHGKRHAHSATLLPNGCVLVAGGRLNSSSATADAELYDPDDDRWFTIEPLSAARGFHEATYLDQDGSVLITGGEYVGEESNAVDRFTLGRPGEPCEDRCECQSGFCVDDVCCDTACDGGACDACSVKAGASADGACSLLTGNDCDDGNDCTSGDACDAGTCAGTNDDMATCGDDTPCTRHACVGGSCVATDDDGATCDDGDPCTTEDVCGAGTCAGEAITCPATDACHEEGTCDPETSRCVWPSKADNVPCEDGGVCIAGACIHRPEASSSSQGGAGAGEPTGPAEHAGGGGSGGSSGPGSGGGSGPTTDDDGGCGCRAAGAPAPAGNAAAALLMAAAAWRASRRRRRP
ncbi:kelch repeat-containing protein [Sorangium sp. So ce406]|uniref:kelch repeat-containing protein n=1 Tax=Sorangium sp. So ce406 TaxID=3133311 RepID=UPI003F5B2499